MEDGKVIKLSSYRSTVKPKSAERVTPINGLDYLDKLCDLVKEIKKLKFDIMMEWSYNIAYRHENTKASYRKSKKNVRIKHRHLVKLVKLKNKLVGLEHIA